MRELGVCLLSSMRLRAVLRRVRRGDGGRGKVLSKACFCGLRKSSGIETGASILAFATAHCIRKCRSKAIWVGSTDSTLHFLT